MAYRYKKKQQAGIGNLDRIALLIFAGAALASFQALQMQLSNFLTISIFLALLAAVFSLVVWWYFRRREQLRLRALAISDVDRMKGVEFEQYVGKLLSHQGYSVSNYSPCSLRLVERVAAVPLHRPFRGLCAAESTAMTPACLAGYIIR